MYYNHTIRTPGEETFTYGELVIRMWNYKRGFNKGLRASDDHRRRLYNFCEYINDTATREGYESKTIESMIYRFLIENWEEYL